MVTCIVLIAIAVVKSYDLVVAMTNGGPGFSPEPSSQGHRRRTPGPSGTLLDQSVRSGRGCGSDSDYLLAR